MATTQQLFSFKLESDPWCRADTSAPWNGEDLSICFLHKIVDGLIPLTYLALSLSATVIIFLFHLGLLLSRYLKRNPTPEYQKDPTSAPLLRRRRSSVASTEIKRSGLSAIAEAENEVILSVVREESADLSAKEIAALAGHDSAIDDEDQELEMPTERLTFGMVVKAVWSNKKDVMGLIGSSGVLALSIVRFAERWNGEDGSKWLLSGVVTWGWMTVLSLIKLGISFSSKLSSLQAPLRPHRGLPRSYSFLELNLIPWVLVYQVIAFLDLRAALLASASSTVEEVRVEIALFVITVFLSVVEFFSPRPSRFTSRSSTKKQIIVSTDAKTSALLASLELNASLFSLATFSYLEGFLFRHTRKVLDIKAVPDLRPDDRTARVLLRFRRDSGRLGKIFPRSIKSLGLTGKLVYHFSGELALQMFWGFLTAATRALPSLFLLGFLEEIGKRSRGENAPSHVALLFAFAMFMVQLVNSIAASQALIIGRRVNIRIKSILQGEVYTKALRRKDLAGASTEKMTDSSSPKLDQEEGQSTKKKAKKEKDDEDDDDLERASSGKILNLISIDVHRIAEVCAYLHYLFVDLPITLVLVVVALFKLLGWAAFAGLIALILVMPAQTVFTRQFHKYQKKLLAAADERLNLATEVISSIRIVKYFAWEEKFSALMNVTRRKELDALWSRAMVMVWGGIVFAGAPIFVSLATFLTQTKILHKPLTAADAFTALSLFNVLRGPLDTLPDLIVSIAQAFVSLKRIDAFLDEQETSKYAVVRERRAASDPIVGFTNGCFTWADESIAREDPTVFRISDLNLSFPVGKISIVIGPVGGGKSTLLLSLLGETNCLEGGSFLPSPVVRSTGLDPAILTDTTAYASQTPWLLSETIRTNIVFGSEYNEKRYKDVLEACALNPDLKQFELGDDTEVGEKGTVLSGGQKARLALARAIYSPARTVLADDVLSAVDSHTAQHLVEKCFKGRLMRHRTLVLVTHAVDLCLPVSSFVVSMDAGVVVSSGAPDSVSIDKEFIAKLDPNSSHIGAVNDSQILIEAIAEGETDEAVLLERAEERRKKQEKLKLIKDETQAEGAVSAKVYLLYLRAMGGWSLAFVSIGIFIAAQACEIGVSFALRWWASSYDKQIDGASLASVTLIASVKEHSDRWHSLGHGLKHALTSQTTSIFASAAEEQSSTDYWMRIYVLLCSINIMLFGCRVSFFLYRGIVASRTIYDQLIVRILGARTSFFDSTPQGRILNRLSKDIETIDQDVANCLMYLILEILAAIGIIGTISVVLPRFLIASFFITIIYVFIGWLYVASSRELRRCESVSKSPIFQLFGEGLNGVATIRAYGDSTRFARDLFRLVDVNNRPFLTMWQANRWLSVRIDIAGMVITAGAACFILASPLVDAALAGFILSFTVSFMDRILWLVRFWSMCEVNANSIERVQEYLEIDQESQEGVSPPAAWPSRDGSISVEGLTATYSPDLPPVLKNVTFKVEPREKIGICGRTGSGKSTLGLSFFRFIEPTSGRIVIDGLDINKIKLPELRSRLTIVAQESALFAGTVRFNMDPFEQFEDAEIWDALRRVQMAAPVTPRATPRATPGPSRSASIKSGTSTDDATAAEVTESRRGIKSLDMMIKERGAPFSAGERQLLALARGILKLRSSNILLLDESTASLDQATDEHIQKTIREEMSDATILCVAHRLKTIIDYDKILVLAAGEVLEFDTPSNLLNDETSAFSDLCRKSGDFDELKKIADAKASNSS